MISSINVLKIIEVLESLQLMIENESYKSHIMIIKNNEKWGGAGVIICEKQPKFMNPQYYYVVSRHASEVSWFFNFVKEISYQTELIDFSSKYNFFLNIKKKINSLEKSIDAKKLLIELTSVVKNIVISLDESGNNHSNKNLS
jgi:hypothetical protein